MNYFVTIAPVHYFIKDSSVSITVCFFYPFAFPVTHDYRIKFLIQPVLVIFNEETFFYQ